MPLIAPFIRTGNRGPAMSAWVLLSLLVPCSIYGILYKPLFLSQILGYALLGSLAETIYTFVVKKRRRLVCTGSALTAALLASSVPPSMPVLPMCYAILLAVWVVKLPMVGSPLRLNAAMAGRLFLMLAYPAQVVNWGTPAADVVSCATPQELYRSEGFPLDLPQLLFGKIGGVWEDLFLLAPGSPGETFPLVILILGIVLCWKGISSWRAPVAFLIAFTVSTSLFGNSAWVNLFTAATVFSAVFIVSDPVSTPLSKGGQLVCGLVIGISNALLREFTYYTEAIVYAVLLGNLLTPLLDRMAFEARGRILLRRKLESLK
jgi:Na+-translocating ferredoxin:NAD+ oxidoreductase RnfD subunit